MFMRNELCGAGRERGRIYSDIDGCGRSKTRSKIVQVTGKTKPGVDFTRLSVHKGWGPDVHILSFSDREMRLPKVFRTAAMPFQRGCSVSSSADRPCSDIRRMSPLQR